MRKNRRKILLLAALYGAVLLVGGFFLYRSWNVAQYMDRVYMARIGEFKGPEDAERVLIEFLDYRCGYCRNLHPIVEEFIQRNPDVKVVFRHYPVMGVDAVTEAEVALAAAMQDKFSAAHNYLITRGEEPISEEEIERLVTRLRLDRDKFYRDMKGPETGFILIETLDAAEALGITSTPTFMAGDIIYRLETEPSVEALERLVEEAYGPANSY